MMIFKTDAYELIGYDSSFGLWCLKSKKVTDTKRAITLVSQGKLIDRVNNVVKHLNPDGSTAPGKEAAFIDLTQELSRA